MNPPRIAFAVSLLAGLNACLIAQEVRDVYRQIKESVVTIHTEEGETIFDRWEGVQTTTRTGQGSGVLISKDGKVLTAAHVVQTAEVIGVEFSDETIVPARVIASSQMADVAMLQLEEIPDNVTIAKLGDSDHAEAGERVFVVGAPYGFSHTLTVGYISARRPLEESLELASETEIELFQTDAAINEGNSGGPMFDMRGEVIGVVSHIVSHSGGSDGLGFAIASNTAKELLMNGNAFWFGMEGFPIAGKLAKILNVPQPIGWLVQRVAAGSPAAKIGLRPGLIPVTIADREVLLGGDIILQIGDISFNGKGDLKRLRAFFDGLQSGDALTLTVLRTGEIITLSTEVSRRDGILSFSKIGK